MDDPKCQPLTSTSLCTHAHTQHENGKIVLDIKWLESMQILQ